MTDKKKNLRKTISNNWFMLKLIANFSKTYVGIEIFRSIAGSLCNFFSFTYMYKYVLNTIQSGGGLKDVLTYIVTMFIISVAYMIFDEIAEQYHLKKSAQIESFLQKEMLKKAASVELACFDDPDFYDAYSKAIEQSKQAQYIMWHLDHGIWSIVNVVSMVTLIVTIHPVFIIMALIPFAYNLLVGKKKNNISFERNMKRMETSRRANYVRRSFYLSDYSKEMRLTNMYRVMLSQMKENIKELDNIAKTYGYKLMWFECFAQFISEIVVYCGSILLASFLALVKFVLPLGDCFVVINSITNLSGSFAWASHTLIRMDENSKYIDNYRRFIEYEIKIPENENGLIPNSPEVLEFKNVSFSYNNKKVVDNVNICARKGEKIAIVGHNGAGKTTLVKLLLRMYDVDDGEILLDGKNIKDYRLSAYRSSFGTVFQDYKMFSLPVTENVLLRKVTCDEDRRIVEDSLKRSDVYDRIANTEKGIDSILTKEFDSHGEVLSGGEAQKLAFARLFAMDPPIIILDEPSSALDPIAEDKMYKNMFEVSEGKIAIYISHRLSAARMADMVYMMENGKVIEKGTHDQLLALNGKYADMWHMQAEKYVESEGQL
ncbi:MAG: ABC transporter ATP-binding protein [Ruminococcaceae bacterium]|nr:ABC transporter ATP-binding protein [Oscillospiraceae bacterium]